MLGQLQSQTVTISNRDTMIGQLFALTCCHAGEDGLQVTQLYVVGATARGRGLLGGRTLLGDRGGLGG